MNNENVELDQVFIAFLDSMKASSRRTYRNYLEAWVRFSGLNGAESLAFKKADTDALTEKKVTQFRDWLVNTENLADNSAKTASGVIRGFFSFHRLKLQFIRSERDRLGEVKRKTEDYLFNKTDIVKMYEQANLTERFVLMVGKSIGFRAGDFVNLTYGKLRGIDLNAEAPLSLGETVTQKESVKAYPFLSGDAIGIVKAMLERGKDESNETRILDYNEKSLSQLLNRLFEKAHLEKGSRIVRFHNLRKYLIDRLSAVMSESQWKQIIGKQISEGAYVSQDQLQDAYKRAMPNIDCLNGNGMTKKKVEDLENALAQTESELCATKTRLDQALKRIEDSEKSMSRMDTRLKTLEEVERKKPEKTQFT